MDDDSFGKLTKLAGQAAVCKDGWMGGRGVIQLNIHGPWIVHNYPG